MALDIVIMAAGKGTRMKSRHPKVLHRLAGRPLLGHVLAATAALPPHRCWVITGHGADAVESAIAGSGARAVRQMPQRGTGHAVQQVVLSWQPRRPIAQHAMGAGQGAPFAAGQTRRPAR